MFRNPKDRSLFGIRSLFHCKAKVSYIICSAQSKRKMLINQLFFYDLLLQCTVDGQCPGVSIFVSRYIRYWNQEWKRGSYRHLSDMQCCCAIIPRRRDCFAPPWEPVCHASDQSLHPGSQQEQRVMTEYWTLRIPMMQPNCSPGKDSHRCKTGVRRRSLSGVQGV